MSANFDGLSVIVPIYNESNNLLTLATRVATCLSNHRFEIIFVDDCSTDNTPQELLNINKKFSNIRAIHKVRNEGVASAWKSGLEHSKYEIVALLDGDLQNPPEFLPKMLEKLVDERLDAVQGIRSRFSSAFSPSYYSLNVTNFLLNLLFRQKATDSCSGFLIAYREVLHEVFSYRRKYFFFQTFLGVRLRYIGFSVGEIETVWQERVSGKSFLRGLSLRKFIFLTLKDFLSALAEYRDFSSSVSKNSFSRAQFGFGIKKTFYELLYFTTFPLHTWVVSRKTWTILKDLRRREFASKPEIQSYQLATLRRLLHHAYRTTKYYPRAFNESSFHPKEVNELTDICKVPLLSKDAVRKNIHYDLFSSAAKVNKLHKISTSGSTGEPFICYADQKQLEIRFATTIRALEMSGWRFGDKQLRLWHQKLGMSRSMIFKERFDAFLLRRKFVPAFEMTRQSIDDLIISINKRKPALIDGYAESLNFLSATNLKVNYHPKAIISSAQELTDHTRKAIEDLFGCKVLDKYGSREFSGIAYQCPQSAYHHVQEESYIVEILVEGRTAKPGEVGEIVITDLNNFSVPMIRYRIGDLAEAVEQNPCPCGRNTMLIGRIHGRTQSLVVCANGVWLPGTFFAHFFKDFGHVVKQFQVHQSTKGEFRLLIIPTEMYSSDSEKEIVENLKTYSGQETRIIVELVTEIPLLKTGKRVPIVSELVHDFQEISGKLLG